MHPKVVRMRTVATDGIFLEKAHKTRAEQLTLAHLLAEKRIVVNCKYRVYPSREVRVRTRIVSGGAKYVPDSVASKGQAAALVAV